MSYGANAGFQVHILCKFYYYGMVTLSWHLLPDQWMGIKGIKEQVLKILVIIRQCILDLIVITL
jgi:hypothetical protein